MINRQQIIYEATLSQYNRQIRTEQQKASADCKDLNYFSIKAKYQSLQKGDAAL